MIRKTSSILCFVLALLGFLVSDSVQLDYPDYFPETTYNFQTNPLTKEKITLGKVLFYDPLLSADNSISCTSCHSPYNAFAHSDHDLSHGINDQIGTRNAPALFNLAWHKTFMWDGAINNLDMQALAPIEHAKEMSNDLVSLLDKLNDSSLYRTLAYKAYQDSILTGEYLLKALSQFQLTLVSSAAKYDKVMQGEASFSSQERSGYNLFKDNCSSCHTEPLFTNHSFANNGLPIDSTLNDIGRKKITEKDIDAYRFKVPSLRNLTYSKPYMHDGRFGSLSEVLKHYSTGIPHSHTLSDELNNIKSLSSNEQVDLIAFLLTLDDKEFVFNPNHLYPREILLHNTY